MKVTFPSLGLQLRNGEEVTVGRTVLEPREQHGPGDGVEREPPGRSLWLAGEGARMRAWPCFGAGSGEGGAWQAEGKVGTGVGVDRRASQLLLLNPETDLVGGGRGVARLVRGPVSRGPEQVSQPRRGAAGGGNAGASWLDCAFSPRPGAACAFL